MATGTVKWFNGNKGYGFIVPDEGGDDVYVHVSAVLASGVRDLYEKDRVEYELTKSRGKMIATQIAVLD
jgi:CspA family cold shock protein